MSDDLKSAAERLRQPVTSQQMANLIWELEGTSACEIARRMCYEIDQHRAEHPADHAEQLYWIACVDRTRQSDYLVFWRPNGRGYTIDRNKAGRYTAKEAAEICRLECGEVRHVAFRDTGPPMAVVDRDRSEFFQRVKAGDNGIQTQSVGGGSP